MEQIFDILLLTIGLSVAVLLIGLLPMILIAAYRDLVKRED